MQNFSHVPPEGARAVNFFPGFVPYCYHHCDPSRFDVASPFGTALPPPYAPPPPGSVYPFYASPLMLPCHPSALPGAGDGCAGGNAMGYPMYMPVHPFPYPEEPEARSLMGDNAQQTE
uniref:Uncharacterized protein n=1 Tax=Corethron hystrix TaxID=216773 RepID=A0A7S1FNG4_9STRA|mmetsp:Transcript_18351/g.41988  ORF Transcript_18351/g.41988 Transcript_18351/m.41988 type:complete len:118 (+) Transcript_18351:693-1046(+)